MIVPRYWAEGRAFHREAGRQVTVRRFGWSDASEADAQATADSRARDALERLLSGEKLRRREPKVAYNGAEGVPIREEILDSRGDTIITRNSYGAHCLNTPNVLFADIDFDVDVPTSISIAMMLVLTALGLAAAWPFGSNWLRVIAVIAAVLGSTWLVPRVYRVIRSFQGGPEQIARLRICKFLDQYPEWGVRLYRTPAGLRVLATHRTFLPSDPAVSNFFAALEVDPVYRKMCLKQQCFRARVTAKPWRIGIVSHMRPRPGTWPVAPERMPLRTEWIDRYETVARSFAACKFLESCGSGVVNHDVSGVQAWHDLLCQATSDLPIA